VNGYRSWAILMGALFVIAIVALYRY